MKSGLAIMVVMVMILAAPVWASEEQVVLRQSANGIRTLRPFDVQSQWEIRWQSEDALAVTAYRADAKESDPLSKLPIATGSQTKGGHGATYIPQGGKFYLQIISMGDWTITVVQLP